MRFHTSQHITFSHFPYRQRGVNIREKIKNDEQTVHHGLDAQERKQEPFATHSEKQTQKEHTKATSSEVSICLIWLVVYLPL